MLSTQKSRQRALERRIVKPAVIGWITHSLEGIRLIRSVSMGIKFDDIKKYARRTLSKEEIRPVAEKIIMIEERNRNSVFGTCCSIGFFLVCSTFFIYEGITSQRGFYTLFGSVLFAFTVILAFLSFISYMAWDAQKSRLRNGEWGYHIGTIDEIVAEKAVRHRRLGLMIHQETYIEVYLIVDGFKCRADYIENAEEGDTCVIVDTYDGLVALSADLLPSYIERK